MRVSFSPSLAGMPRGKGFRTMAKMSYNDWIEAGKEWTFRQELDAGHWGFIWTMAGVWSAASVVALLTIFH